MDKELKEVEVLINKLRADPENLDKVLALLTKIRAEVKSEHLANKLIAEIQTWVSESEHGYKVWLDRILTVFLKGYLYEFNQEVYNNDGCIYGESETHDYWMCNGDIYVEYDTFRCNDDVTIHIGEQGLYYKHIYSGHISIECCECKCESGSYYDPVEIPVDFTKACKCFQASDIWRFIMEDFKSGIPANGTPLDHLATHRALDLQIIEKYTNPKFDESIRNKVRDACTAYYDSIESKYRSTGTLAGLDIDYTSVKWSICKELAYLKEYFEDDQDDDFKKVIAEIIDYMVKLPSTDDVDSPVIFKHDTLFINPKIKQTIIASFDYKGPDDFYKDYDNIFYKPCGDPELLERYPDGTARFLMHNMAILADSSTSAGLETMLQPVIVPLLFNIINILIDEGRM